MQTSYDTLSNPADAHVCPPGGGNGGGGGPR